MKKQFAIKAVQSSKNIVLSATKNESANLLKLLNFSKCCEAWDMQGIAPKTAFSL